MTRANIPHFGRPFGTELSENEVRALIQAQGNFQAMSVEWPLLIQNTGTGGLRLRIDPAAFDRPAVAVVSSPGIQVMQFKVVSLDQSLNQSDVIKAQPWPGGRSDPGNTAAVWIAKPWFLRGEDTWSSLTRLGITYSQFSAGNQKRRARAVRGAEVVVENQTLVPLYLKNDIIVAMKVNTGVDLPGGEPGENVDWLDLNTDARMWMVNA